MAQTMFGSQARVGITTSALPSDVLRNVENEKDLQRVIEDMTAQQNEVETSGVEEEMAVTSAMTVPQENLSEQAKK